MSLYPSLEDMKVDQMGRAQVQLASDMAASQRPAVPSAPYPTLGHASVPQAYPRISDSGALPYPLQPPAAAHQAYPGLSEYMGLEFTHDIIAANMPEYLQVAQVQPSTVALPVSAVGSGALVAPISGSSAGLKAAVTNSIREVILCKDAEEKIGMRVKSINKGVFVCLVKKNSPAALAGLRFGDQLLQIDDDYLAGMSMDKVHDLLKKASTNGIRVAVRDRPFERTITLHKDSAGHVGFQFRDGEIAALVKDSSAARNGLLTEHQILEIDGQNVVGVKDKELTRIFQEGGQVLTITVMPAFVYKHMMKHMSSSLVKFMDHSIPDL